MLAVVLCIIGMAVGVSSLVLTAATRAASPLSAYAHMVIAAVMGTGFAVMAIRRSRGIRVAGAAPSDVGRINARYMGTVWAWGALMLLITYGTGILFWKEWWHFFIAFTLAGGLCLLFAATLEHYANMLRWARYFAMSQLVGMILVVLGLLIDGKMVRFLDPRHTDWAANNVFFFGALSLAAISGHALRTARTPDHRASA